MQKLTMQQQQQQQQNPLLQKAKAFNQSFFTQPSQDRHVTRSRSAPPASTTRECQRGMSNFCSPEGSGNFVGLQCSSVNSTNLGINYGSWQQQQQQLQLQQQYYQSDNRSFDETSYMQLPMPSKQQQQQQRQLPQSQCQPQEERSQSQINSNDLTPEERFVQRTKSLFFDILVKDHTCPGVIQETLDGKEDFNAYAFEIAFCGNVPNKPKPIDPISIIEAIKLRIDYERTEIRKNHSANTSTNSDLEKPHKDQSRDRRLPRRRRRSGVTEEDIDNHFAGKNKSEVNDAVCAFLQAEAEYRSTNVEGRKDFEANVNAYEPKLMGKDIKTNTYTATTKPID
ncbi:uncharacterized protein Dwil_GK12305 [Drosophila willistoni]|uniref:Uncharacterized protein n=1 Tax=Drosophila willistoni TaxID=7260 RepID=A0A0Q9X264_DROWI|nr:uncharacterized protein Dwil_GK12305 [Drosophila willistoni]